jgi:hypothetical protein
MPEEHRDLPRPDTRMRFSDQGEASLGKLLETAPDDIASSQRRLKVARSVLKREDELNAWLGKDPANATLLATDPGAALAEALPGLKAEEIPPASQALVNRLVASGVGFTAGVLVYDPPEVLAVRLLAEVGNDAAARPDGYGPLLADVEGVVGAVAAGRYSPEVVALVVAGVRRAFEGVTVPLVMTIVTLIPPGILTLLDERPDALDGATIGEAGDHGRD